MKTIVISGASRGVGKSTLAARMAKLLPGASIIKIGSHKNAMGDGYFSIDTKWETIVARYTTAPYLIIESNSIHAMMQPDLSIFLDGENKKPSSVLALSRADIISGSRADGILIRHVAGKLKTGADIARKIILLSGARTMALTGVILVGGQSSRMGEDKALLKLGTETMVKKIYDQLSLISDEVIIIGAYNSDNRYIKEAAYFTDPKPDMGPLMGITTALHHTSNDVNFILSCDTPEFHPQMVSELMANLEENHISVPVFSSQRPEPLCAIYRNSVLVQCENLLQNNIFRPSALFGKCSTAFVEMDGAWFSNLNTPADFKEYIKRKGLK